MNDWFIELNNIHFSFYVIFIFFFLLLVNYYYLSKPKLLKYSVFFLRLFSIIIVLLLLLNPIINIKRHIIHSNSLNLFFDNSKSIELANIKDDNNFSLLVDTFEKFSNDNNIEFNTYNFSDTVSYLKDKDFISFNSKKTNFSNLFNFINSNMTKNDHSIIISDGLNNQGLINFNKKSSTNIHALGVGEILNKYDLAIASIDYEKENNNFILDITFETKNLFKTINEEIYLNNEIVDNYKIGSVNITDDNYTNIKLKIDDKYFSTFNVISIKHNQNDYDSKNNSFLLNVDDEFIKKENMIFFSGSLSPNTRYIKQILNESFPDVNIIHYYKINNIWNKEFSINSAKDASSIILDNINIEDMEDNILSNVEQIKTIYFVNNNSEFIKQKFLEDCVNINDSINLLESVNIKNYQFDIPPLKQKYSINCNNEFDGNSYFFKKENNLVVNIDNLYQANNLSLAYNEKNNLFVYIGYLIEDFVYNKSDKLNIFTDNNLFMLKDSIKIFHGFDSSFINPKNISLIIKDVKNNKINLLKNQLIEKDLAEFIFIPVKDGYYEIVGVSDNGSKLDYSNKINLNVVLDDIELNNVYLDENYLSEIALINNGSYFNINEYKKILSDISFEKKGIESITRKDFLSYQYLVIILIFLLILEWYIRNRIGLP